jgi:hypothetical protein
LDPREIKEIELDETIIPKAKIYFRNKNRTIIKVINPKWEHRYEVYKQIVANWLKEIEKEIDE